MTLNALGEILRQTNPEYFDAIVSLADQDKAEPTKATLPPVEDYEIRVKALDSAMQLSISRGDADGQKVIRRSLGIYKFLTNTLNENDTKD